MRAMLIRVDCVAGSENHFVEWCVWVDHPGIDLGVTAIPPMEIKRCVAGRGVSRYQARVSKFIPRPPKRT